jgi:3-oxoacyl-[acyl-carrier protein] reductase
MAFAREGAAVAALDIDLEQATATAASVRDAGGTALALACDVSDADAVQESFSRIRRELGVPDALFNNAGIVGPAGTAPEAPIEEFDRCMAVNLRAMFLCAAEFIRGLLEEGKSGSIVNTASVNAVFAEPGYAAYIASKGGVAALTRALALHHISDGIRVNCVCPGTFLSGMHTGLPAEAVDAIAAKHPLGLGSADDLVGAYSYLAGDASRWTTGSAIVVDGGYAAP